MTGEGGPAWWEAMRRVRTLGEAEFLKDDSLVELVEERLSLEPGNATSDSLLRYHDLRRNGRDLIELAEERLGIPKGSATSSDFVRYFEISRGLSDVSRVPGKLERQELLGELSKVSSDTSFGEKVEKLDGNELKVLLDSRGGPSSSGGSRGRGHGWWWAMKKLRKLPEASKKLDHELVEDAEKKLGLEGAKAGDLMRYFVLRREEEFGNLAKVPRDLSWSETLTEITKKLEGRREEVERKTGARNHGELKAFLDSLGGPSSSSPDRIRAKREEVAATKAIGRRRKRSPPFSGWTKTEGGPPPLGHKTRPRVLSPKEYALLEVKDGHVSSEDVREPPLDHETRARNVELWANYAIETMREVGALGDEEELLSSVSDGSRATTPTERLLSVAFRRCVDHRNVLARGISYVCVRALDGPRKFGGPPQGEPKTWWDSMRRLRTMSSEAGLHDDEITFQAETMSGLETGSAKKEDIEELLAEGSESAVAQVPVVLSRSEALTEIGKFGPFEGMSHKEIGGLIGVDPTTKEIKDFLFSLGGPSSSSPERTISLDGAMRALGGMERFRGSSRDEIVRELEDDRGVEMNGRRLRRLAHGLKRWSAGPPPPPPPLQEDPEELLSALGGIQGYQGLSRSEIVEKAEAFGGPASLEGLEGILGNKRPPDPPLEDLRWWNSLRRVRSLVRTRGRDDALVSKVEEEVGIPPGAATFADLDAYYDLRKHWGFQEPRTSLPYEEMTRSELLVEISKHGAGIPVSRAGGVATTEELSNHLDLLGGPSSSRPSGSGWWDSMRRLRTLEGYHLLSDHEIATRAKRGPGSVEVEDLDALLEREREGTFLLEHAGVPRRLTRTELLIELSKLNHECPGEATDGELEERLSLLGGPSSSDP